VTTEYKVGDLLDVTPNTITTLTVKPITTRVLVESGPHSMCNSDGEEWWVEWHCVSLQTGKRINISNHRNVYHIKNVS
jgi:hypothetical protein